MVIRVEEDKTLPALSSGVPGLPLFLLVLPLIVLIVVFILIAAAWAPAGSPAPETSRSVANLGPLELPLQFC